MRWYARLGFLPNADPCVPPASDPFDFQALKYLSRFNQQPCVALFQKPGVPERCRVLQTHPLVSLPESDAFLVSQRVALI